MLNADASELQWPVVSGITGARAQPETGGVARRATGRADADTDELQRSVASGTTETIEQTETGGVAKGSDWTEATCVALV